MSAIREENPLNVAGWFSKRLLPPYGKIYSTTEAIQVVASVARRGFRSPDESDATRWLRRVRQRYVSSGSPGEPPSEDLESSAYKQDDMDPRSGHITTSELTDEDPGPPYFSVPNTEDLSALVDELLGTKDFGEFGDADAGGSLVFVWDEGTGSATPELNPSAGGAATAFYTQTFDPTDPEMIVSVSKGKCKYRLRSEVAPWLDPLTNFSPASVEWPSRKVTRAMEGDEAHAAGELLTAEDATLEGAADVCDAENYRSTATEIAAPPDPYRAITPEGVIAGAELSYVLDSPVGRVSKGGFAAYINSVVTKIYRRETAIGSFAGVSEADPARTYEGFQRFQPEQFYWDLPLSDTSYQVTFSEDVPRRYVSGPFVDRLHRRLPFDVVLSDDQMRTGFTLHSQTATVRVWKRLFSDEDGTPVEDTLTTTLSEEVTTAEIQAFAAAIAAGSVYEHSDLAGDFPADNLPPPMLAAKVLSSDETAAERRYTTLTITASGGGNTEAAGLTVRWKETTITSAGDVSQANRSTGIELPPGGGSVESAEIEIDVADGRKFLSNLQCDPEPSLIQPIWMRRSA